MSKHKTRQKASSDSKKTAPSEPVSPPPQVVKGLPRTRWWDVLTIIGLLCAVVYGFIGSVTTVWKFLTTGLICTGSKRCYAESFSTAPWLVSLNFFFALCGCLILGGIILSAFIVLRKKALGQDTDTQG